MWPINPFSDAIKIKYDWLEDQSAFDDFPEPILTDATKASKMKGSTEPMTCYLCGKKIRGPC